jgi:protein kinase C substrate 80K-H
MSYTGGQRCWGGPDRSAMITVECGSENELSDPSEPNKCEYTFSLKTPVVCTRKMFDQLQQEINNFGQSEQE